MRMEAVQKDLTREMKFDEAIEIRTVIQRVRDAQTADARREEILAVQAASPVSIESLLRDAVDQDRAIQLSLKTVSKDRAAEALKDLQELLAAKSDDGDLDACLEIRERIRDLRNRYPVEQQLPEVLPTDEKGDSAAANRS